MFSFFKKKNKTPAKKAIIAGVGPGNGMAIARRFAEAGYTIALLARSADKLEKYAEDEAFNDIDVLSVPVDFADLTATQGAIKLAIEEMGGVDVLVFNASLYNAVNWKEYSAADLMREVTVGAGSAYSAMRAAGEYMAENGGGSIIATGGGSAVDPVIVSEAPGLAVTKGAMRNLVLSMAPQFKEDNIFLSTVTIMGTVQAGTFYDPELISKAIFDTAHLEKSDWVSEVVYQEGS